MLFVLIWLSGILSVCIELSGMLFAYGSLAILCLSIALSRSVKQLRESEKVLKRREFFESMGF